MENCDRLEIGVDNDAEVSNHDAKHSSRLGPDTRFKEYWKGEEDELAQIRRKVSFWIENYCDHQKNCEHDRTIQ